MSNTAPQDPQRTNDLALIHAAAKRLCLDDDTYRCMLIQVTGQRSSKDLDAAQRAAVLAHLGAGQTSPRVTCAKPESVSDKQWRYITDLAGRLHLDDESFTRLVKHITGLDHPQWLSVPTARRLLAGMLKIEAYQAKGKRMPQRGAPRRAGPDARR